MDEKNAAVSELLLSRHWHVPTSMQHWGGVSSTDLESSPACLGGNELAFITRLLSGRAHQQHSWTTSGGSWRNLGVGPLVCSTESQGQASSTRLSNNWAMLNSSLHHWGQQTLPAGTALATAQPIRSAEQQLPGDWTSSCVSMSKVEIHLHSYFTGCKPTREACCDHMQIVATKVHLLAYVFFPFSQQCQSSWDCVTLTRVLHLFRGILSEWDRLEGIVLLWLFQQGGLMRGVGSPVPVPCSAIRAKLQPAQEKLPFVVARYPCSYLTKAAVRTKAPQTSEFWWCFYTYKLKNLGEIVSGKH